MLATLGLAARTPPIPRDGGSAPLPRPLALGGRDDTRDEAEPSVPPCALPGHTVAVSGREAVPGRNAGICRALVGRLPSDGSEKAE